MMATRTDYVICITWNNVFSLIEFQIFYQAYLIYYYSPLYTDLIQRSVYLSSGIV